MRRISFFLLTCLGSALVILALAAIADQAVQTQLDHEASAAALSYLGVGT
jgi:hypothetical protein